MKGVRILHRVINRSAASRNGVGALGSFTTRCGAGTIHNMRAEKARFSAPEGAYPAEQWPIDVMRTDESGELDLEQIEYNLSLTPAQRLEQYFQWVSFVERMRRAAGGANGMEPRVARSSE